jgi:hypothetical protein
MIEQVWGGPAQTDGCNVCNGTNITCADCASVPNGNATFDLCAVCDVTPSNDCQRDCEGIWGGGKRIDVCYICGGNNDTCLDCAGVPFGAFVPMKLDKCGLCDRDSTNDCLRDCVGIWGGEAALDLCGVCNGNESTCVTEEVEVTTPNAVINLLIENTTNLTMLMDYVVSGIGAPKSAVSVSLNTAITLAADIADIPAPASPARSQFELDFRSDVAALVQVNVSDIRLSSVTGGSVVVRPALLTSAFTQRVHCDGHCALPC